MLKRLFIFFSSQCYLLLLKPKGALLTTYMPQNGDAPFVVDMRHLKDDKNVCVVYHNPYDNVKDLAHIFFKRCLEAKVTPYIVTKKTVFKWQEGFWSTMKSVFDSEYKDSFLKVSFFHILFCLEVLCSRF